MEAKEAKILIVDDMTYVRVNIRKILVNNGFHDSNIMEANDGVSALKMCRKFNPDIVILDLMLPKINGLNLIGLLLSINHRIKIVVCSVIKDTKVYSEALMKGAVSWIQKPVSDENLIPQIEKTLNVESQLSQADINNFVEKSYDYSEKIGIKLDSKKKLQILNLYGILGQNEFRDLKETVSSLKLYKYNNVILNLNGITKFDIAPDKIKDLKNKVEKDKGRFMIVILNESIKKMIEEALGKEYFVKTEIQAVKELKV